MTGRTIPVMLDRPAASLCARPYPGHPRGCDNLGRRVKFRAQCPPSARPLGERYAPDREFWFVWIEYDLEARVAELRTRHPNWTDRQLRCSRYWQGTARKAMREEVERFIAEQPELGTIGWTICPEAYGVNVTETMWKLGVYLEWPPRKTVRLVTMLFTRDGAPPLKKRRVVKGAGE